MKKVLTVVGARPQFIKAAPVSKALRESKQYHEVMVHTGQHYDERMSATFFDELDMQPADYNLGVGSASHAVQTGEIMKRLEAVLEKEEPEVVMVYGDTNSTLAAAITASKLHIPIAHIEAGLRSYNKKMAEEINRLVADHLSTLLFCPTTAALKNLEKEGITENAFNIGDVMYDVAVQFSEKAKEKSHILRDLGLREKEYILATIHRAENTDNRQRLSNIFSALEELGREMPVVIPMHPRTRKMLFQWGLKQTLGGIRMLEPVGFLDMISLERNARLIATDSGGVQKEAYFHQVPCMTLRDETEWVETIDARWNVLVNADTVDGITETAQACLRFLDERATIDEYGDGRASQKIVDALERYFHGGRETVI
jgi:UDP-GlcNAc3NAcA epimerase